MSIETKRFTYTGTDGIIREADGYVAGDFVTVATPDAPVKTTSTGQFDPTLIPQIKANKAGSLVLDRKASGVIATGDLVRATTLNHVTEANPTGDQGAATVLGIAQNSAANEQDVEVLVFGIYSHPMFSIFAVNSTLFLDEAGGITDVRPVGPTRKFLTVVGKSLGGNDILINIQPPLTLGT